MFKGAFVITDARQGLSASPFTRFQERLFAHFYRVATADDVGQAGLSLVYSIWLLLLQSVP